MINTNLYSKPHHPDAETARNWGIAAVVCFCLPFICGLPTSFIGIFLGFVAASKGKKVIADFHASPGMYRIDTLQKAETAKTMGLVGGYGGIVVSILWVFFITFIILMNYLEHN